MAVSLPEYRVLPYAARVAREVRGRLGDKKRVVRAAAVRCLNAWLCFDRQE